MLKNKIEAKNITKNFGEEGEEVTVLNNINFTVREQEFVSLVGPSGCGKSTLFNIIAGLLPPTKGQVIIDNKEVTNTVSNHVGYMLQKDMLLPWRTVLDNVILGLEVKGVNREEAIEKAKDLFNQYNLKGFEEAYPDSLSGGMRQRVALMRTMVQDPEVILMDEPFKALDYPMKLTLEDELLRMIRDYKKTVVYITHDIEEAVTLSNRVYVMKSRPGEINNVLNIDLGTDSTKIVERRSRPQFNDYYYTIWQEIEGLPKVN